MSFSLIAQDIYDTLTEKGYRVFFSRITLEDKLGVAYEPYIFAALNSAKVMLAIGTDYENYNAVWVKNECSRFLKLIEKDKRKHLIPCYKDIDAYDIPKEFKHLQAQDMGKVGAMQDLVRGIDKILATKEEKHQVLVHEGMSKEEKKALRAVKRSQQFTRFFLFLALFGVIFFFGAMLLHDSDTWIFAPDSLMFTVNGEPAYISTYDYTPIPMIPPAFLAVFVAFTLGLGLRSTGAHWANLIFLTLIASITLYAKKNGIELGNYFLTLYKIAAVFPILTSLTARWKNYKIRLIHLVVTLLIIAATLLI